MNPSRARRSLFGPVNHELLRKELSQRLRDITERDSRRWNFDFQSDSPLPGRFQWEAVSPERAAAFYGGGAEREREACARIGEVEERLRLRNGDEGEEEVVESSGTSDQENRPRVSDNIPRRPEELAPARRKRARSKSLARTPQNARITDFFVKRRRSVDTKSVLGPVFSQSTDSFIRNIR